MNLSLSKKADYVLKAGIALARSYNSDSYLKLREIAAEMAIPRSYTPQILDSLIQAGLAQSRAGKTGGYKLNRSPNDISVLEVVEAGEGSLKPNTCALSDGPCRWERVCPLHEIMSEAVREFRETLAAESLADLAKRDLLLERGQLGDPTDPHERRDLLRQFLIKDFIHIETPLRELLNSLEFQEGEWLAPLMEMAITNSVNDSEFSYLLPANSGRKAKVSVNLGTRHQDGTTTHIPLTCESVGKSHEVPLFVGSLSVAPMDESRTLTEISGRVEFGQAFFQDPSALDPENAMQGRKKLEHLAGAIGRNFLKQISTAVETKLVASS